MKTQNNKLIVLEGIDGVGKTTLALELKKLLQKKGHRVILYEEHESKYPGFNSVKNLVKKMPISGSHLFYLASSVYKSQIIEKLLKKYWVICDRYVYSSNAYHRAMGSKLKVSGPLGIVKPDVAFLITINENIRMSRIKTKRNITKADRVPKRKGSLPYRMEKNLKSMGLVEIDNSGSLENTLNKIMLEIGSS